MRGELWGLQRWDSQAMVIENGVYLGWPAALTFRGPFIMSGVRWEAFCLRMLESIMLGAQSSTCSFSCMAC